MFSTHPAPSTLSHIPGPAARRIAVCATPRAERALRRGHPWLFERAIRQQSHDGAPGDWAVIFDRKRSFLAVGLYDPHSLIRVRILQHGEPAAIDRLKLPSDFRRRVLVDHANGELSGKD